MLSTYVEKSFTRQSLSLLHMSSTGLAMSTPSNSWMPFNIFLHMLVPLWAYIITSASPCGTSERWRSWNTHRLSERPTGRSSLDLLLQLQLTVHHRFAHCTAHPSERPRRSLGLPLQLQHMVHHQFACCTTYRFERPGSSLGLPLQLLLMVHHQFAHCATCPSKRPRSFLGMDILCRMICWYADRVWEGVTQMQESDFVFKRVSNEEWIFVEEIWHTNVCMVQKECTTKLIQVGHNW